MATASLDSSPAAATEVQADERSQTRPVRLIGGIVAALVVLGGATYFFLHRGLESTDDAQIDGEIVAVPARIGGIVTRVHFVENQHVKAGDLLAEIEDSQARVRLAEKEASLSAALATADAADAEADVTETNAVGNKSVAEAGLQSASVGATTFTDQIREGEAQVHSAEVSLAQARSDHERAQALFASGSIPKAELDRAQTAFSVAESAVEAARARVSALMEAKNQARSRVVEASARVKQSSNVDALVRQAQARSKAAHAQVDLARSMRDLAALDLSYTKIVAPHDGVVSKKGINEGQSVALGQSIVQLVTPGLWVTANYKETQVGHFRPGQPATVSVDAYPGMEISGEVESVSGATGARFTLLAPDNATGNFTKIVQRVPVRVHLHELPAGVSLRPGMSVEATVNTR